MCFPVNFCEISKNTFLQNTSGRLLLFIGKSCSIKRAVLKNFATFTEKHLCWSLFFSKVADLQAKNFIKKGLQHVFSCESKCENTYFKEHLWMTASESITSGHGGVLLKVFLENSQNSQENICTRALFLLYCCYYYYFFIWMWLKY